MKHAVILACAFMAAATAQARPRYHCEEPGFDFGTRSAGETVRHAFRIGNRGETDLVIERVRSCCGASAAVDAKTVPPGSHTLFRVVLPLAAPAARTTKTFYLHTSDPANRIVPLRLTGKVAPAASGTGPGETDEDRREASRGIPAERVELAAERRAVIEFFFEAGCRECDEVERRILPGLAENMADTYELRRLDTGTKANYIRLAAYQKRFGIESNEAVSMVVNGRRMLDGLRAISDDLVPAVAEALADAREPDIPEDADLAVGMADLRDRAWAFTVGAVIVAGLSDGINPCAISALVFFLSLLAVFKVRGRTLLLTGAAFCLASFLTYTAIGFGLLRTLHAFRGFPAVRTGIERVMVGVLAVFAVLSFLDAWRFARSGKAGDVTLKLPERLQRKVHGIMRSGLGTRRPVLAGFGIGAAVTVIESVCTGQVYVPTLTLIARDDPSSLRAWGLLLLYNAMFVVPLIVAFVLTSFGLRTETLVVWSRRHVVFGKVLLGLFFAAMAALMLIL